jgi:tetratricopeptide (TPR) repeat protein
MNNLANCYGVLGQQGDALKLHQEALARRRAWLGDDATDTLQSMHNVAVAYAALGRHAEALALHEETLARRKDKLHLKHPDTVSSMNAVAWLLATAPDPKLRNTGRALELAKKAVELAPQNGDYLNTLGVARYRVGDWEGAVGALTKSMEARGDGDAMDWFFLALAHWRLGRKDEGRAWYERAVQWTEKNRPQDEELSRFRAEAASLLGVAKP